LWFFCFQEQDDYLVEQRVFDPLYDDFSLFFISFDWRTVCLVFPKDVDIFLSCQGEQRKNFVRLSYDGSNWLSKRIGLPRKPEKITFLIAIKHLLRSVLAYIRKCISSILLILINILSSE
jgi:hypothetical protein